jgi:hypothetical protein
VQPGIIAESMAPGSSPTAGTWYRLLLMLFGTSSAPLAAGLALCALAGAWVLVRRQPLVGGTLTLVVLISLLMSAVSSFGGIEVPIVLARYLAIVFPVTHVCTAAGLIRLARGFPEPAGLHTRAVLSLRVGSGIVLFSLLAATNPLRPAYAGRNSFTNHSAFIESGGFGGWNGRYRSAFLPEQAAAGPVRMSRFYLGLPANTRRLIEYPMMIGDHYNYYYLYQHRHGKDVVIGYTDKVDEVPADRDGVGAEALVDLVIHTAHGGRRPRFRNMVDIQDAEAVRRSGADYLICHRDLLGEFLPGAPLPSTPPAPGLKECLEGSAVRFGPPVFEDDTIVAFDLRRSQQAVGEVRGR